MADVLRVGVIGAGALGGIHVRVLSELEGADFIGLHDADDARMRELTKKHGGRAFASRQALIAEVDACIVAAPTKLHAEIALDCIAAGVHVMVEKPLTSTLEEGREVVEAARKAGVVLMVGHVERFNPAVLALLERDLDPRFLEAQRVSPFSFRSTEVGVVLDLMIHDIDLILHLVKSPVRDVHAVGIGVVGDVEDMANARITFENGAVANVTASRVALKTERKLRLFARDCYVSLDFKGRSGRITRPAPGIRERLAAGELTLGRLTPLDAMTKKLVKSESLSIRGKTEPLGAEDSEFLAAIREKRDPAVPGEHGLRAMETADRVLASIAENLERGGSASTE